MFSLCEERRWGQRERLKMREGTNLIYTTAADETTMGCGGRFACGETRSAGAATFAKNFVREGFFFTFLAL